MGRWVGAGIGRWVGEGGGGTLDQPVQTLWHGVARLIVIVALLLGIRHHLVKATQKFPGAADQGGVNLPPRKLRLGLERIQVLIEVTRAADVAIVLGATRH